MSSGAVLVTGATGKLGTAVCRELLARGHRIRGTDRRHDKSFPAELVLGDLCDEFFVHRLFEGVQAVVHLGNHPNQFAGPSPARLLSENVAMNANVFQAAVGHGVGRIVFASSIQVMIRRDQQPPPRPHVLPYLPLDGDAPANPGTNSYALSKEFAERMLRLLVEQDATLSATALRYPMLVTPAFAARFQSGKRTPLAHLDFVECTAHLFLEDAARLVGDVLAHGLAGYHQYFPALTMELGGYPARELVREHFPHVHFKRALADGEPLIDLSAIERDLGWRPHERLRFDVER
jgi:nucleoside-diphosphate-sugar epimerase